MKSKKKKNEIKKIFELKNVACQTMAVSDNFKAQIISRSDNFHAQIISRSDNFQDLLSTIDFFVGLFDLFSLKKKKLKSKKKKKKKWNQKKFQN